MAVLSASLAQLYLAYLGRSEDAYGALANGAPATVIQPAGFNLFWDSPEYRLLAASSSAANLVEQVYQRVFNRAAEAAAQVYWQQEVASGRIALNLLPAAILQGAQNADSQAVANKLAVSQAFFDRVDTAPEKANYSGLEGAAVSRAYLQAVGSDPASLASALAGADAAVAQAALQGRPAGVEFALTAQADVINALTPGTSTQGFGVSTNGPDGFIGTSATLGQGDRLDGGLGQDYLAITIDGNPGSVADIITSVELVHLGIGGTGMVDLSGVRDLQAVGVSSSGATGTATVRGMQTAVPVGAALTATASLVLEYGDRNLPGEQSATVDLQRSSGGNLSVPGIEHLTLLTATAAPNNGPGVTLGRITAPEATTVTVTGSGLLTLSGTFDMAAGGRLTIDFAGSVGAAKLAAGANGTIVFEGSTHGGIVLDASVGSVISNSSGPLALSLDRDASAQGRSINIAANGTGAIQVLGGDSPIAIVARGSGQSDTFFSSKALDVFTGGGAADDFVFGTSSFSGADAAALLATAPTITDFSFSEHDRVWSAGRLAPGTSTAPATAGQASVDGAGMASFAPADTTLLRKIAAVAAAVPGAQPGTYSFAAFTDGADSYLFVSNGQAGLNPGDILVRLAGVQIDASHYAIVNGTLVAQ
ncbi:MAG: hypothetical protein ABI907_05365 [Ramlibacter sp.]